jgi:tetratricopeptide (TPR) repeat protein
METIKSYDEAASLYHKAYEREESGDFRGALSIREKLADYDKSNEKFILSLARSYSLLNKSDEAEFWFRKAIFIHPFSELSSLQLFHFLVQEGHTDKAFEEVKRFESIAHSADYDEIMKTILASDKY